MNDAFFVRFCLNATVSFGSDTRAVVLYPIGIKDEESILGIELFIEQFLDGRPTPDKATKILVEKETCFSFFAPRSLDKRNKKYIIESVDYYDIASLSDRRVCCGKEREHDRRADL